MALVSNHNTQQTEDCLDISNCSQKLIGFDSQICSLYKVFLRSFQHVYHTLVYVQKGLNSHDIRKRWYVPFCDARFHSCLKWSLRPYIYRSKIAVTFILICFTGSKIMSTGSNLTLSLFFYSFRKLPDCLKISPLYTTKDLS